MRAIWMAMLFGAVLLAQGGKEAYPGQSEHKEPPKGWYCVPTDTAKRMESDPHACDCLGMISDPMCTTKGQDESGNEVETPRSNENAKCRVWCFRDRCTCTRLCHDTRTRMPEHQRAN